MATISLRSVRKSYGLLEVLHGVSIDISEGEFVSLVGPSGCGKSTLLRIIAGLESVTDGDICIDGNVVNDLPPKARDVAMVFQSYALYPHMTVAQNLGFSLKVSRHNRREIEEKVAKAAEILGLTPLLGRRPSQLSGGQRQRVAMGRAIVRDPSVFLFDEPLSNLDAQLRVQMRAEIKSLHQRLRTTMVYVTHDQVEAVTMADRIVVMNDGNVEQVGAPLELFDRPANLFVARFIGSPTMNLIEGNIRQYKGGILFKGERISIELPELNGISGSQDVVLGIRPEQISLATGADLAELDAVVDVIEPTGTETLLHLRVSDKPLLATIKQRLSVLPGAALKLEFDPANVHLFDRASGARLG